MPLDPFFATLLAQAAGAAPAEPSTPAEMRESDRATAKAFAPDPLPEVASARDTVIAGVPTRVYRPVSAAGSVPTVVFFHGGGWMIGDLDTHDAFVRRMCRDVGAVVVAVDYRLSPERPFPAGYEDCLAVARAVADHLDDYGGGPKMAIAGDSAGGNLAAGVVLAFRDDGRPLAGQLLIYPALDLDEKGEYPSLTENGEGYGLTTAEIRRLLAAYLADDPTAGAHPPASPIRAETFEGLPPTVIGTAQYDPLRDQGVAYAEALLRAGIPVRWHVYEGLPHAFITFTTVSPTAEDAVKEMLSEFAEILKD